MIKQYKVTVNGKLYDVSVEEVGEILGGVHASKTVSTFVNPNATVNNSNNEKQIAEKPQNSIPIDENAISVKAWNNFIFHGVGWRRSFRRAGCRDIRGNENGKRINRSSIWKS